MQKSSRIYILFITTHTVPHRDLNARSPKRVMWGPGFIQDIAESVSRPLAVATSVTCLAVGTSMIVFSHCIPSPLLFYGIIIVASGIPGCEPPLWAFAVPLA